MSEPYCVALVLCDAVHTDPTTRKNTILGTFSTVETDRLPAKIAISVYWAITECEGTINLRFQIVHASAIADDMVEPEFTLDLPVINSPSPLVVIEGQLSAKPVELSRRGVYHCELYADDVLLMSRRLVVYSEEENLGSTQGDA